jgi:hypothetical protein
MASSVADIEPRLDRLARRFEDSVLERAPGRKGWGQFLDTPRTHAQVGTYGTAAGVLVLSLANRGQSTLLTEAVQQMRDWWESRLSDDYAAEKFLQTPRLAFFGLALRLSGVASVSEITSIEDALFERLLPLRVPIWSAYWQSTLDHDATPSDVSSSIVLICFSLLRNKSVGLDDRLSRVAEHLEQRLIASDNLAAYDVALSSVAILATKGKNISKKARRKIRSLAYTGDVNLSRKGIYHYHYKFVPWSGPPQFRNEYFIVPTEVLVAIAGFLIGAPSALRLRAETTLDLLIDNLGKNTDVYRATEDQYTATKNQAWIALLLELADQNRQRSPIWGRLGYQLFRNRKGNWFTETMLPAFFLLAITIENVLFKGLCSYLDVFLSLGALIIGGIYGPAVFRKLIGSRA